MRTTFDPRSAALLAKHAARIQGSGHELAALGEADPELAGDCGVEICSLEARTILASGAPARVVAMAGEAARRGQPTSIETADMEAVSRLEQVVSLGSSRIALKLSALEAQAAQEPTVRMGSLMGLATGAVGLFKTFFP